MKTENAELKNEASSLTPPIGVHPSSLRRLRPLLLVLVVASWASATVVSKHLFVHHLATPLTLVVCRFTLAGVLALGLFRLIQGRNQVKTSLVGSWKVYLFGGGLMTTFIIGFNLALLYITATLGGLVFFGLTPVVMLVIGRFWLGNSLGWRQVIGVTIALLGMMIVLSGGDPGHFLNALTGSNLPLGLGLMVVSAMGWGSYSLWGKRYMSKRPGASLLSTGLNQLIGVAPVWLLYLLIEPGGLFSLNLEAWLFILYIGIVPSCLGFALFNAVLKDVTLNQAATVQLLSPVFTAIMAIVFLGEPFGLALLIGTLVLLSGVRVSTSAPRRR